MRSPPTLRLEVHREVQTYESREGEGGWRAPARRARHVVGAVDIRLVEASRVARVEQVVDVHADIAARPAETDDLREAHVHLRPALIRVDAMLVVRQQDGGRAGRRGAHR